MRDRGELPADAGPERLALAALAALQGGLVLTQVRPDPAPFAAAMDTVLEHIEVLRARSPRPRSASARLPGSPGAAEP